VTCVPDPSPRPLPAGAADDSLCYWCQIPLDPGGDCPRCGRRQVRICFCGQDLAPDQEVCPNCNTEWRGVVKIRRRRRKRPIGGLELAGYIALGVFGALAVAALLSSAIGGLALKSAQGPDLPEPFTQRLALAMQTLQAAAAHLGANALDRLGGLAIFIIMGIVGGALGAAIYLYRERRFRHH
jgi:hypothetical protein